MFLTDSASNSTMVIKEKVYSSNIALNIYDKTRINVLTNNLNVFQDPSSRAWVTSMLAKENRVCIFAKHTRKYQSRLNIHIKSLYIKQIRLHKHLCFKSDHKVN